MTLRFNIWFFSDFPLFNVCYSDAHQSDMNMKYTSLDWLLPRFTQDLCPLTIKEQKVNIRKWESGIFNFPRSLSLPKILTSSIYAHDAHQWCRVP